MTRQYRHAAETVPGSSRRTDTGPAAAHPPAQQGTRHHAPFPPEQARAGSVRWAAVSNLGGIAEVNATCPAYGGPFCTYPWYAFNDADDGFTHGAD